ncbi:hypothetical protein BGZ73_008578 [Actinomortierella ambigua]|nr:hypothetical protein BGZ73_008578 [Actinomortierella ambigua]
MASSRSHRGGIRRLSLVTWAGMLILLALAIFATLSSASPIREKMVKKEESRALVTESDQAGQKMQPGDSVRTDVMSIASNPVKSIQALPPRNNNLVDVALMAKDAKARDELSVAGSREVYMGIAVTTTSPGTAGAKDSEIRAQQNSVDEYFRQYYNSTNAPLTWQRCVGGGILLAIGLYLTLFGYRFQRFTLLLTGFIGGVIAAYAILVNVEPEQQWSNRVLVYCAVCIAAGLFIGLLMLLLNRWAIWVLGGAGGLCLGVFILSWRNGTLIHSGAGRIGLMVGCAALGLLLGLVVGPYIIVFASVLLGGYMFTIGLDLFLRTGFMENYKNMFSTSNTANYTLNGGIYGMLGVVSLMYLLGLLIQLPLYIRHLRYQRLKRRAAAVPPVGGPGAPYYGYNNRPYPPGASRENLLGPNSGAPGTEKREYNWWGKRINKEPAYPQQPPYYYNEKSPGVTPPPRAARVATAGAAPSLHGSELTTPTAAAQSVDGKTVVFEEQKDWRGRTKVVPKVVAAGAAGAATGAAAASTAPSNASIRTETPTVAPPPPPPPGTMQGAAMPTNWLGQHKLVSTVDKKSTTIDKIPKETKAEHKAAKAAAADAAYNKYYGPSPSAAGPQPRNSTDVVAASADGTQKKKKTWNPFGKDKHEVSGMTGAAAAKGHQPRVTFSQVEGPDSTDHHDNEVVGVASVHSDKGKGKALDEPQPQPQQQQQPFFNQTMGIQPQMQPNAYSSGYSPYGYYQPPPPAPPQPQPSQDQMAYILVGVDGQSPSMMENVRSQPPSRSQSQLQSQPQPQPQSQAVVPAPAPAPVAGPAAAMPTPPAPMTAAAPVPAPAPALATPAATASTPTPGATTTTTTAPATTTTPSTPAAVAQETAAAPAKQRHGKKLMGSSMSKLFGRRSEEQTDPIKDRNTDELMATSTTTPAV